MKIDQSSVGVGARNAQRAYEDAKMDRIMGRLLQVGVLLAAGVVLGGGAAYLKDHAHRRSDYRWFKATPMQLRHPEALLHGLSVGDSTSIIQLGILLLVATPICRVVFAVWAFAAEHDKLYVAVSLTILAVLLYGMSRGT